ncbi:MAG: hypothetical protein HYT98_01660 [Candidatus Sungbacteria bacterium]|nr:hypothetical protein [Candidatus Sungbacteria bacterium]
MERPKQEKFHIGPIIEMKVPQLEMQKERLDNFIEGSRELRAMIEVIKNQYFTMENIGKMVDSWNQNNKEWAGAYVEKQFKGAKGLVLIVRMDRAGNVQLKYFVEKSMK